MCVCRGGGSSFFYFKFWILKLLRSVSLLFLLGRQESTFKCNYFSCNVSLQILALKEEEVVNSWSLITIFPVFFITNLLTIVMFGLFQTLQRTFPFQWIHSCLMRAAVSIWPAAVWLTPQQTATYGTKWLTLTPPAPCCRWAQDSCSPFPLWKSPTVECISARSGTVSGRATQLRCCCPCRESRMVGANTYRCSLYPQKAICAKYHNLLIWYEK